MVKGTPAILTDRMAHGKRKLEEYLEKNPKGHVTLLALGEAKTAVLKYLNSRNNAKKA